MYGLYGFLKKKLYGLFFENCTNCTDFLWKCTDFCTDFFKKVLATLFMYNIYILPPSCKICIYYLYVYFAA